jgi:hypothetical protein
MISRMPCQLLCCAHPPRTTHTHTRRKVEGALAVALHVDAHVAIEQPAIEALHVTPAAADAPRSPVRVRLRLGGHVREDAEREALIVAAATNLPSVCVGGHPPPFGRCLLTFC